MDRQKRKKIVFNIVIISILLMIIFFVFYKDYQAIWDCLSNISVLKFLLLLVVEMGYQILDSAACFTLVRKRLPDFRYRQAAALTFLGIFGNVSTFAAGTVPLQCYYLYGQGAHVGSVVGMMAVEYIFHKAAIFFYAIIMLLAQKKWLKDTIPELMLYIYLGFVLCAAIVITLVLLCTWDKIQQILLWGIEKLPDTGKWRERKFLWSQNLHELYEESKNIFHNRACCQKIALLNILKLSWLFLIPFLCMKVLNISGLSVGKVQVLSSIMLVIIGVLPNMAGVGPAEFAFLMIFTPYIGKVSASSALILYRIVTYFFPFVISIGVFLKVQKKVPVMRGK